jgi:hypothetical protein
VGGCNRVAFSCVSFLSTSQCVQLGLESARIDHRRCSKFISHGVTHHSASIGQMSNATWIAKFPVDQTHRQAVAAPASYRLINTRERRWRDRSCASWTRALADFRLKRRGVLCWQGRKPNVKAGGDP